MNSYIARNVVNMHLLINTSENRENGLIAVIDCDINDNCISLISYLNKDFDNLQFHQETESVMKYLKESNTFNLLENRYEMERICGFCPDFEVPDREKHFAFSICGDTSNYYIDADLKSYTAQIYVYKKE